MGHQPPNSLGPELGVALPAHGPRGPPWLLCPLPALSQRPGRPACGPQGLHPGWVRQSRYPLVSLLSPRILGRGVCHPPPAASPARSLRGLPRMRASLVSYLALYSPSWDCVLFCFKQTRRLKEAAIQGDDMLSATPLYGNVHSWMSSERVRMCGINEDR